MSHDKAGTELNLFSLRLLSGVKKLFIFQHHDGKVVVRNDVVVTHLTSVSLICTSLCHVKWPAASK